MANINAGPFTTRPEIDGTFGVVATTHWIATAVGMAMLERGGNAFDAGIATAFTLQVVEPHLCGPGGDVPVMLYDAKRASPRSICGQGPAPAGATIAHYRDHLGLDIIPGTGPAAGLRARHVRDLHDDPARLRHHAPARRAGAGDRLRAQRPSARRARVRHHRHRRRAVPRALADLGRRLSAGRQGAGAGHAVRQRRSTPRPTSASSRRPRPAAAAARPRSSARAGPGARASSPRRSTRFCRTNEVMDVSGRRAQGRAHRAGHGDVAADDRGSRCISTTATTAC